MSGPGPVVAELGRSETPAETAARKAEDRRLRRSRQTARNLVYSLLVTVGLVAAIVLIVPRAAPPAAPPVDYRSIASQTGSGAGQPLLAPKLPAGWRSNAAELRGTDAVSTWYVGFVTPHRAFAAYSEGIEANDTWLGDVLTRAPAGGTVSLGGLTWRVYDQRSLGSGAGNVAYGLATGIGTTDLVVYGTAATGELRSLATALAGDAKAKGLTGADRTPKG